MVFLIYWKLAGQKKEFQNGLLLIASFVFYGWWSFVFLSLLIATTLIDFFAAKLISSAQGKRAKVLLCITIVAQLSFLAYFKYANFFIHQFQLALSKFGIFTDDYSLSILLPIGISFYTFHGISYVVDVYKKKQVLISNFIDYGVFVSFFPLLVAGPIERAHHLLPQISVKRTFDYNQIVNGLRLILWGFFKKVVIADSLAGDVNQLFGNFQMYDSWSLIIGVFLFSIQIYCDFSGYSDIAIGLSKTLGIEVFSNFKFPYFSRNVLEFWKRWHISLTSWFRDYLYIPLGGSKNGKTLFVRNICIVFIVSGLWHGASWNFIFWGGIHAIIYLFTYWLVSKNKPSSPNFLKRLVSILITFFIVSFAWIFFRANSLERAFMYIKKICDYSNFKSVSYEFINPYFAIYMLVLVVFDYLNRRDERNFIMPQKRTFRWIIYVVFLFCIVKHAAMNDLGNPFIYFQF